jgi:protein-tyrosine phosphatase
MERDAMNILFVCTANISRSYLAEALLRHELAQRRMKRVQVASSGILAMAGSPPDPVMTDYLKNTGIEPLEHKSTPMSDALVQWADRILVMEQAHADHIRLLWPQAAEKVELLGKYISPDEHSDDVIDPFGKSPYHYRTAQAQIQLALQTLVKRLSQENLS